MSTKDPFDLASGVPAVGAVIVGEISPKPKASIGLSKKVAIALMALAVLVVVIFIASLDEVEKKGKSKAEEVPAKSATSGGGNEIPGDLKDERKGSVVPVAAIAPVAPPAVGAGASVVPGTGGGAVPGASGMPGSAPAVGAVPPLSAEEQRVARVKLEREQREMQARQGGLEAKSFQGSGKAVDGVDAARARLDDALAARAAGVAGVPGAPNGQQPLGDQEQKLQFMKDGGVAPDGYHKFVVAQPVSPYELKAGSVIPAVLEMAVNSDLPGLVTARVRENVYASVRDEYLLIPSMSKLVGSYDSRVALGQSRQLLVWNRIIYPDGSELNLAGMPTGDVSGQSGLEADVDNHYLRLFGVTLGMSLVTAGVQLSVPPPPVSANGQAAAPSNAQVVSAALAQQFGQLGGQVLGKYLNVQPTLRNAAGERFNIVVPRNIVFPGPWRAKGR